MLEKLKGKKTYISGTLAILTAVGTFLSGDIDAGAMLQMIVTAVVGMTLRAGVNNAAAAAAK